MLSEETMSGWAGAAENAAACADVTFPQVFPEQCAVLLHVDCARNQYIISYVYIYIYHI